MVFQLFQDYYNLQMHHHIKQLLMVPFQLFFRFLHELKAPPLMHFISGPIFISSTGLYLSKNPFPSPPVIKSFPSNMMLLIFVEFLNSLSFSSVFDTEAENWS